MIPCKWTKWFIIHGKIIIENELNGELSISMFDYINFYHIYSKVPPPPFVLWVKIVFEPQ